MIINSFQKHSELADKSIIKMVVMNQAQKSGWNSAQIAIKKLMDSLENTGYYEVLEKYMDWAIEKESKETKLDESQRKLTDNPDFGEEYI